MRCVFFIVLLLYPCGVYAQTAGEREYNTTTHLYEFYNGASWIPFSLGAGSVACTKEGEINYNTTSKVYEYCNGILWIPINGVVTADACTKEAELKFEAVSFFTVMGLFG